MGTENKARRLWLEVEIGPEAEGVHDELRQLANALADYDHVTGVSFGEETVGFGDGETIALQGEVLETTPTASNRLREWAELGLVGAPGRGLYVNRAGCSALRQAADELDALDKPDDEPERAELTWRYDGRGEWTCRSGDDEVGSIIVLNNGRFEPGHQCGMLRMTFVTTETLAEAKMVIEATAVEKAARGVTP